LTECILIKCNEYDKNVQRKRPFEHDICTINKTDIFKKAKSCETLCNCVLVAIFVSLISQDFMELILKNQS